MKKKILASALAITLTFGSFAYAGAAFGKADIAIKASAAQSNDVTIEGKKMYNDYIALSVDVAGHFTMGTTGGNPDISTDDNAVLLYAYPNRSTSKTTLAIDGSYSRYDADNDTSHVYDQENKCSTSKAMYGDIEVKQVLSFVNNTSTGRDDVIEIKYVITNKGSSSHNVGLRIMLDTMLGENDGAPFRVPGIGQITKETEFSGSNVPQYWQAFDNLDNPSVVSQGSFLKDSRNKPDKVQFVSWNNITSINFNYAVNANENVTDDSAVNVIWNEKELKAGESRTYRTHYGMSALTQNVADDISLSVSGDTIATQLGVNAAGLPVYQPLNITSYVQNKGTETLSNAYVKIKLPAGLSLAETGDNTIVTPDSSSDSETESTVDSTIDSEVDSEAESSSESETDSTESELIAAFSNETDMQPSDDTSSESTDASETETQSDTYTFETLDPNQIEQAAWQLYVANDAAPGIYNIQVITSADGLEEKSVIHKVQVGEGDTNYYPDGYTEPVDESSSVPDNSSSQPIQESSSSSSTSPVTNNTSSQAKNDNASSNPSTGVLPTAGLAAVLSAAAAIVIKKKNK